MPVEGREEVKGTNEIKMAIPLLEAIDIEGKDITADALLTQRELAEYLVTKRQAIKKSSGEISSEIAYGITSRPPQQASPQRVLKVNRGHWVIENRCHYILDWTFAEDRSRIRTGYGPENMTRLRRFAIGVIKSKGGENVTQTMRQLTRHVRLVFDYLRMTENSGADRSRN